MFYVTRQFKRETSGPDGRFAYLDWLVYPTSVVDKAYIQIHGYSRKIPTGLMRVNGVFLHHTMTVPRNSSLFINTSLQYIMLVCLQIVFRSKSLGNLIRKNILFFPLNL